MTTSVRDLPTDRQVLVEFRLHPSPRAPFVARRLVGSLITSGPRLRALDAALLTAETAGLAVGEGSPFSIAVTEAGRHFRVAVTVESADMPELGEIRRLILERISDRWAIVDHTIWFEIDLIRRQDLSDLSDERLFALLPDDLDARDELFERYSGFAVSIARRYRSRDHRTDDLDQVAQLALIHALERFDPEYGVQFTTFARHWISGVVKRHFRDHAWSLRVPRGLKEDALQVAAAREELAQRLGREPRLAELAHSIGLDVQALEQAIMAGDTYFLTSLDAPVGSDAHESLGDFLGEEDPALGLAEDLPALESVLDQLTDREQQVLYLRFFEDLTQAEIAAVVGVSQVHVSRMLKDSLGRIRVLLSEE